VSSVSDDNMLTALCVSVLGDNMLTALSVSVTGDNMLTALSVARECGMVGENQRIILVQAFPGTPGHTDPWVEYMYTEDPDSHDKSTVSSRSRQP
jgi:magnesium-transporting ATPase (P-type)